MLNYLGQSSAAHIHSYFNVTSKLKTTTLF